MESTISGMFFCPPPPNNYPPSQLSGVNPYKTFTGEYPRILYRIQYLVIGWPSRSVWGLSIHLWPRALFRFQTSSWQCREVIFMPPLLREITHSLWGKASTPSIEPLGGLLLAFPEKDVPLSRHPSSCLGSRTMDLLLRGPTVLDPFHLD